MPSPRPSQLQIFGERCSGTNFVAQLLRRNLPGLELTDRYGWKHGWADRVSDPTPDCVFVVVHRDPFDWVRSLHKTPWHTADELRKVSFSQFVRVPWHCEWGRDHEMAPGDTRGGTEMMHERDRATGERFANCLRMRAAKMRDWSNLATRTQHAIDVRYEDVVADPRSFVREFAARFGLRRWPWFRAVRTFKGGPQTFVPTSYEPIDAAQREWILGQLDLELERAAGYGLPASVPS